VRYAVRLLQRETGFALVATLTIAIGVGAATTLFSVANGVLLKPLPWPDADRLIRVSESRSGHAPRIFRDDHQRQLPRMARATVDGRRHWRMAERADDRDDWQRQRSRSHPGRHGDAIAVYGPEDAAASRRLFVDDDAVLTVSHRRRRTW